MNSTHAFVVQEEVTSDLDMRPRLCDLFMPKIRLWLRIRIKYEHAFVVQEEVTSDLDMRPRLCDLFMPKIRR